MRIYVVDDNIRVGNLLKETLEKDDIVVSCFLSGKEVLKTLNEGNRPDIILMDVYMPEINGIELTRMVKEIYPDLEIIIQTVCEEPSVIIEAIEAGVSGYILKAAPAEEVMNAINIVKQGGAFATQKIAKKIRAIFSSYKHLSPKDNYADEFNLTKSEKKILCELIKYKSNEEIAAELGISAYTVNMHLRKIYKKLEVNNRKAAIKKALD